MCNGRDDSWLIKFCGEGFQQFGEVEPKNLHVTSLDFVYLRVRGLPIVGLQSLDGSRCNRTFSGGDSLDFVYFRVRGLRVTEP